MPCALAKTAAKPVCVRPAAPQKHKAAAFSQQQKLAIASAAATFATAIAPAAQAAQEVAMTAEGEAAIIQIGWGALAASFSLSLCMTVWGRAGL